MKDKYFSIPRLGVTINLMTFSHIFKSGDGWTIVTASGSKYAINEEEYNELKEKMNHKDERPEFDLEKYAEMKKKLIELGIG